MQSDPLADFLTILRNAVNAKMDTVELPFSRLKFDVAKVMEKEGYVQNVQKLDTDSVKPRLKVGLRHVGRTNAIRFIERLSKPGRRHYVKADEIPRILGGLGVAIVSTSQGVMAGHHARKRRLGGELLCAIY